MKEITTKELKKLFDEKAMFALLDCRGVDYFNWEHISKAINLRWKYVEKLADRLFPDKKISIVTYCDGFLCRASMRCYENLRKLGYANLFEYSGGLADWKAHGFLTIEASEFKIAPNVYRFPDQMFYGENVGSYLIEENDFLLLVDGPQQLTEEHEDFIAHFDKPIKVCMSHGPTAGEAKKLQKEYGAKIYLHKADTDSEWLTVKPDVLIDDEFSFAPHLNIIHTPGHSPGSSVLLDEKNKLLFTGDHIEGDKKGEIYDFFKHDDGVSGDVRQRLESAKKLLAYDFDQVLPFHYEMIRKNAKSALADFVKKYDPSTHSGS